MKRRRGITLIEQVVVGGLLTLVVTLAAAVLQPCLVDWKIVQDRSDMQRSAMLVTERVSRELLSSSRSSVTLLASPPAFSFASGADSYDAVTGTPVWGHFVVYFLDAPNRVIYRKCWPAPGDGLQVPDLQYAFPSTRVSSLREDELLRVVTTSNGTERVVGTMVDHVQLHLDSQAAVLDLQLSLHGRRGLERVTRRTTLHMRLDQ